MEDMSPSSSDTESLSEVLSNFEEELEEFGQNTVISRISPAKSNMAHSDADEDVAEGAYQGEPIASKEWLQAYEEHVNEEKELESELQMRLSGETAINEWCRCGHCDIKTVQNISECYCCTELDGCVVEIESENVQQDLGEFDAQCITQHPGFRPVCLEKWTLRLDASHFKTQQNERYRQTGSENKFLRSVAYRNFTRLVYGRLGNKRIPLPSCAYTAIRDTFPVSDGDCHKGFDLDNTNS